MAEKTHTAFLSVERFLLCRFLWYTMEFRKALSSCKSLYKFELDTVFSLGIPTGHKKQ